MTQTYFHSEIPELSTGFQDDSFIILNHSQKKSKFDPMDVALCTMRIAIRLGIKLPTENIIENQLCYDSSHDNLVYDAPFLTFLTGSRMKFLRGWQQYESCIKGFNALGLMAEQILAVTDYLNKLNLNQLNEIKIKFLSSRIDNDIFPDQIRKIFTENEVKSISNEDLLLITIFDLAIWLAFADKTIVCSTSSNMGISLHEALRFMQRTKIELKGKSFSLLNYSEGYLIIWCPDENADFMNKEKTTILRKIEAEKPKLTELHTYINRKQRDPGALMDALNLGGYFFPTNPQSKDEIHNLLFSSLYELSARRGVSLLKLLEDEKIKYSLDSLGCTFRENSVVVSYGVEGGMYGLMLPYIILFEEILKYDDIKAVSTWNQASIGAALAAAVMADEVMRDADKMPENTRSELNSLFPCIGKFIDYKHLGKDIKTSIHGVFDIANLQSLAQLLGVVVERHLSGRGTAFVGLGSSSYANGNRCYEILKNSFLQNGAFQGKSTFHPVTHTINYISQCLIVIEDLNRLISQRIFIDANEEQKLALIRKHVKKTEPAGAAALSGYLLARLDSGTLSIIEIVYTLKLGGFDKELFLQFIDFLINENGANRFLQEAQEEGPYMGEMAQNLLLLLDWKLEDLQKKQRVERIYSGMEYHLHPLDSELFESLNPVSVIYLTGDNTGQPDIQFIKRLFKNISLNKSKIDLEIHDRKDNFSKNMNPRKIKYVIFISALMKRLITIIDNKINSLSQRLIQNLIKKNVERKLREVGDK